VCIAAVLVEDRIASISSGATASLTEYTIEYKKIPTIIEAVETLSLP